MDHELNVVFDNCPGQNKNNTVIRLVPCSRDGLFSCCRLYFLIAGHTKNCCDRWFNILKATYRMSNIYTMEMLLAMLASRHVKVWALEEDDMKHYGEFLNLFFGKMPKTEIFHIVSCDKANKKN